MGTKLKTWKYPMSSHVTEQLMDLLWNYLLVVTDNEKRMAWNILLTEEVTERGRQLISGGEEVLRIFLQKILCELKSMFYWTSISWNKYLIHILCTNKKKRFLAHLSQRLKWAFLINICPLSVFVVVVINFSHFHLLLQNQWANFNQTWHKSSLCEDDSSLFKWRATPFSKRR